MFIEKCDLYNYADDNFLSHISKTPSDAILSLTHDINVSINWFEDNGMQANPDKFQFLALSPTGENKFQIYINEDTIIKSEQYVKALGVTIDNKLNFTQHISNICKKAARQLNALTRISNHLDLKSRKIIYQSFVASNFNYCPLVWHFCGKLNTAKIEKIQERALKIIYKDYESTYHDLLLESDSTTLFMSRIRLLIIEVFKCIYKFNPQCLNELFTIKSSGYTFRNSTKLIQPKKRTTTYGLRSVVYTGAKIWNDIQPYASIDDEFPDRNKEIALFKEYLNNVKIDLDPTFNYI